jgi:hypothetical protein
MAIPLENGWRGPADGHETLSFAVRTDNVQPAGRSD